jgi:hypothetical protein
MNGWKSKAGFPCRSGWLLAALVFPAALTAQVSFYGVTTGETLWSIDALTQTAVSIGTTGVFFEGLALSPTGALYGTDSSGILYSLNPQTGAATSIGSTGLGDVEALHFVGSTLIGASSGGLFSIDTATGSATNIVTFNPTTSDIPRDLAVLNSTTLLFSTFASPSNLYSVNINTGVTTLIGSLAVTPTQFAAMDFGSDGILYGFNDDGNVYQIDPNTAAVTLLGNTGAQFWLDATGIAVPEPATWALMGLGTGLLLANRRWRKRDGI